MRILDLVKLPIKVALTGYHCNVVARRYGEPRYIFLLSHTRACTTLLSHILGSHPEISGHSEQWLDYPTIDDLKKLHWASVCQDAGLRRPTRFLFDKLLHNQQVIGDEVLTMENVYIIFMLRPPEATLKSAINWYEDQTEEGAVQYYVDRLGFLEGLAGSLAARQRPPAYVDAESIIDDTGTCLELIRDYLGLQTPLDENYTVFPDTGRRDGAGDMSPSIFSGEVKRDRPKHDIVLSQEAIEQTRRAYDQCRRALRERSVCV
ncbi:MAG: hypothetical protein CMJ84_16315 [Planctomycetes bacterium]|nr:hypothetical protein [Planctomycetota bacterium]